MRVFPISRRLAVLAVVRGAAGLACLVSDRRSRFLGAPTVEPLPPGAHAAPFHHAVAVGLWPSTLGVTVFAVTALAADAVLAALMAGILAGMAVASVVSVARIVMSERADDVRYYGEFRGRGLFSSPR